MKVLLTQEVEDLGLTGDIVEVADGYGRNYLLPKGLAVEPTEENQRRYEKVREERQERIEERREWAESAKEKLDGLVLEVERKAQEESERLYGSVRVEDVISLVEEEVGVELKADQVKLDRPIEKLGEFDVPLKLYGEITATLEVHISPQEEE